MAAWEQTEVGAWGTPQRMGLDAGGLFAALSLVQPMIAGARRLAPHVQRIGPQRLLLGGALAAGAVAAGELALRAHAAAHAPRVTPQGGALSPLLANIYLHPFDLAMTSHGMRLVRFMAVAQNSRCCSRSACHAERSEASLFDRRETLRCAQGDKSHSVTFALLRFMDDFVITYRSSPFAYFFGGSQKWGKSRW